MYKFQKFHHNLVAQFMFDITLKGSIFLYKHAWLYWLLQFTWGLIYNIIGSLIMFIALGINYIKTKTSSTTDLGIVSFHRHMIISFGKNWGGLSLGWGALVATGMGDAWTQHTRAHEAGHNYQNCIWGPLAIFLIYIPSLIRWVYYQTGVCVYSYDQIWFEDSASVIGEHLYNKLDLSLVYPDNQK